MSAVYQARDARLNRSVAIKVLPDAFVADADRVRRFEREAQTLAALNHPGIAQIYGLEEVPASGPRAASRALVMEFVDGEDLAHRLARGPIPVHDALPIAEPLEAAHHAGIVHRDLKPSNVKVRPDGTAKVLDFGLAKAIEPGRDAAAPASGRVRRSRCLHWRWLWACRHRRPTPIAASPEQAADRRRTETSS